MSNEITDVDDRLEPAPWEAWMRDVLHEYRIPFDNTTQGLRAALCMWMAEHNPGAKQVISPPVKINAGEGYRLLKPDEVILEGDEFFSDAFQSKDWALSGCIGSRPIDIDSYDGPRVYRRKINQGKQE